MVVKKPTVPAIMNHSDTSRAAAFCCTKKIKQNTAAAAEALERRF